MHLGENILKKWWGFGANFKNCSYFLCVCVGALLVGAQTRFYLRYCVRCHLVTGGIQILHLTVIGPFVGNIEGSGDWATVWIDAATLEQIAVQLFVQIVHGIVECEQHNLWNLFNG